MRILFYFLIIPASPDDVLWKNADLSHIFNLFEKKGEIEVTFWILLLESSHWITIRFNMVSTQWINFGLSVRVVKKLLSISPFVTKVPFVALKLRLSNSLCMITWCKLVFSELPLCTYCFIYMCTLFCHFSWSILTKKGYYSRKQGLNTLTHGCIKVHGGVPIVLCLFGDPL